MKLTLNDIHPLTDFQRNSKSHIAYINKTSRPEVLTVNGKAAAVLIGTSAYEDMMDQLEQLATLKSIATGLADLDAGRTVSAEALHRKLLGK